MPAIPAILLVAFGVLFYVTRTSAKVAPSVTFAKPTTVIPAGTAIFAAGVATLIVVLTNRAGLSPLWVLGLGPLIGLLILRAGGSTSGSRVVYDRGGLRLPPGRLVGIAVVAVVCFTALIS